MNKFPMHDAARDGDLERVRQLIEAGVPVDSLDEYVQTPLHVAADYGAYEVAELLINSGCDLDIKDRRGCTPVLLAAGFGMKDIVDLLLRRGAHVNCADEEGQTLLHTISQFPGWMDIVQRILDNGEADLNAADQFGNTPLICAVVSGHKDVAALLIRAGADVNRSDLLKRTALHWSVLQLSYLGAVPILLEKEGLHLSPQDVNGDTPLHLACKKYRRRKVRKLLDAGADINMKNNEGKTALSVGIKEGKLGIEEIRLFVEKGAFLENCHFLKENVLKDVELCTQSVVNKFNRQSLPALNSIAHFARRLPNVDNFKLGARQIDEVRNLVKCEIERNTFCDVVKIRPIALSALCVLSLITCQSGKKRAASTGLDHSPFKKNRN